MRSLRMPATSSDGADSERHLVVVLLSDGTPNQRLGRLVEAAATEVGAPAIMEAAYWESVTFWGWSGCDMHLGHAGS